jgi:hypothetical protein
MHVIIPIAALLKAVQKPTFRENVSVIDTFIITVISGVGLNTHVHETMRISEV